MTDPEFHLETPRLYLSYFQPSNDAHCDFLVALYNTPEFLASIGGAPTAITTREAARDRLANRFPAEHARNGYGTYLVSAKPSPPPTPHEQSTTTTKKTEPFQDELRRCKPVGTVSLMRGDGPDALTVPDLGFAIIPDEMRKGYAKEASLRLLEFVREKQQQQQKQGSVGVVEGVVGLFDPGNEASRGVFRSLGFQDRGVRTLKEHGGVRGAVWTSPGMAEDLSVYGL